MSRTKLYWLIFGLCWLDPALVSMSAEPAARRPGVDQRRLIIAEFLRSRPDDLFVINARDLMDTYGKRRPHIEDGYWTLNFGWSPKETLRHGAKGPVVIFVHGYNTSASEAVESGSEFRNYVMAADRRLQVAASPADPQMPIPFYLFLWSGDFGEWYFGTAQAAADHSAKSLADFISYLWRDVDRRRIVLIAHSLGSRVALEALSHLSQGRDGQVLVGSLVLVQGAVEATTIRKWTAKDLLSGTAPIESCGGPYADTIRHAGQLLYTFSKDDTVLLTAFGNKEWYLPHVRAKCFLPYYDRIYSLMKDGAARSSAIGSPFKESFVEIVPTMKLLGRDPTLVPKWDRHRDRFIERVPSLESSAQYWFDFRIDHPNVERIDLDAISASGAGIENWHSPIFGASGAPIVTLLWRRVLEGLGTQ